MGILAIKNAILKCVGLKMANAAIRFLSGFGFHPCGLKCF